jgi:transposase
MILSKDLRKRAIEAIVEKKMHITEVAKIFQLGRRTLYTWLEKYKKEGVTEPKTRYQKGHSHKITDLNLFITFVKENQDCTTAEMAIRWSKQMNQKVCKTTILRMLAKTNFTFKKKRFITPKQIQENKNNF